MANGPAGGGGASTTSWRMMAEMALPPIFPSRASRCTSLCPSIPAAPMIAIHMSQSPCATIKQQHPAQGKVSDADRPCREGVTRINDLR